jgi:hypothetical protein
MEAGGMTRLPIMEEVGMTRMPSIAPVDSKRDWEMQKMSLDDALRIIRNVAGHNPHDVPSPALVVKAVGISIEQSTRAAQSLAVLCQKVAEADTLMRQASSILGDVWDILKDLEREE